VQGEEDVVNNMRLSSHRSFLDQETPASQAGDEPRQITNPRTPQPLPRAGELRRKEAENQGWRPSPPRLDDRVANDPGRVARGLPGGPGKPCPGRRPANIAVPSPGGQAAQPLSNWHLSPQPAIISPSFIPSVTFVPFEFPCPTM
jgi:hypothetical protein